MKFETRCVHIGVKKDKTFNSATTPIYPTSTYHWDDLDTNKGYDYSRHVNPTKSALEENLAALEGGDDARATNSGMAAILTTMTVFQPGDHIIAGKDIYGGTYRLFQEVYIPQGFSFSYVDMSDLRAIEEVANSKTKGIWIETPSNPLLKLTDLKATADLAKRLGATTIADNTFLSPYLQRPMELGIDIVVHSTTKYLNGHSDVIGGCVITQNEEHLEKIDRFICSAGTGCSPFDAWLVLRGIKTLGPRMEAHQRGAMAIAKMLEEHDRVERVFYPGLESHPQHQLAKTQQFGFGGMLSFSVKGGGDVARHVLENTHVIQLAESLGGVESLMEYPWTMSHVSMPEAARREVGITESVIRLSVGIEHPDDLLEDLGHALNC